jgi:signal transduction histidine kinase
MAEITAPSPGDRSEDRQGGVGIPDRSADLVAVQVRAAATAFLRARPLVVAPAAAAGLALLVGSGAPAAQVRAVGAGLALAAIAFSVESLALRSRQVSPRWLRASLGLTALGLAVGIAASGGLASPQLPLLFAPIATAFAAFGRGRESAIAVVGTLATLVALGVAGSALPFARPPEPAASWMTLVATSAALLLIALAVIGFADAYRRTAASLDRLRAHTVEEALDRARRVEALGAVVAHEVKNPLSAIKGLLQLSARDAAGERAERRFAVALAEVDRIERTLNDVLAFASPLTEPSLAPVELGELVSDLALALEGRASASRVVIEHAGAASIEGDARRLREALLNLAVNAIEAMPAGGRLRMEVEPRSGGGARVTIADTGDGLLDPEAERFDTTKEGGTGLGLAIARRAVGQHGGTLRVRAEPGRGTTLEIDLPARPGA